MAKNERQIVAITNSNPNAMTTFEISGNDREKALELLNRMKEIESKLLLTEKTKKNGTKKRIRKN